MSFGDGDFHPQKIVTLATTMQPPRVLPCLSSSWIYMHATKLTNNKTQSVLIMYFWFRAGNGRSDVRQGQI